MLAILMGLALMSKPFQDFGGDIVAASNGREYALLLSDNKPDSTEMWLFKIAGKQKRLKLVARQRFAIPFSNLIISPNGKYLAAAENVGSDPVPCYLISARSLRVLHALEGCQDYADMGFTPDSRYLLGSSYATAFLWRTSSGKRERKWNPFGSDVDCDPEGSVVQEGGQLKFLLAVDRNQYQAADALLRPLTTKRFLRKGETVFGPSKMGKRLVAFKEESAQEATLFDLQTQQAVASTKDSNLVATANFDPRYIKWSPSGRFAGVRSLDRQKLTFWPARRRSARWTVDPHLRIVSQDWNFINDRVIDCEGSVLRDVHDGRVLLTFDQGVHDRNVPEWIVYMPDGAFAGSAHCRAYFSRDNTKLRRKEGQVANAVQLLLHHS